MRGCLLRGLHWGPGLQPRHVPWLGIEPATLWFSAHAQSTELCQPGWLLFSDALIPHVFPDAGGIAPPRGSQFPTPFICKATKPEPRPDRFLYWALSFWASNSLSQSLQSQVPDKKGQPLSPRTSHNYLN